MPAFLSVSTLVNADCTEGTRVEDLSDLLVGKTVCVPNGSGWDAQEYHQSPSGAADNLIDWHSGPRDPSKGKKELPNTDPTDPVGKWKINGNGTENATITYDYGDSAVYVNTVHNNGDGTYSFCNNEGTETIATIQSGQGACGSTP